jgi:transposase
MDQKYFIGIDISKGKIDCAVISSDFTVLLEKTVKNSDRNITSFLRALMKKFKVKQQDLLVCCEHTGIYNKPLERVCLELGIGLWQEQALKIKRASTDMRGKSDSKDAMRIAEYAVRYHDRKVLHVAPSSSIQKLNALSKARETLIGQKTALENQLREAKSHDTFLYDTLKTTYNTMIRTIKKQLATIDEELESTLSFDNEIKENAELVRSVPGVGKVTALQMIIATNNFKNFKSAKHLACYSGVVPFQNESGTIIKKARVSKMANLKLKTLLHLSAMAAVRTEPELKEYYKRMVEKGKNKMSVINAVRNKLVHRIWAVVNRKSPFLPINNFLSN